MINAEHSCIKKVCCIILSKVANSKEVFSNGYVKEMEIENKIFG